MAETPERWVDVNGYEGYYQVSNLGRVKSLGRNVTHGNVTWFQPERIMSPWAGTTSLYDCVRLYKNGIKTKFTVHRLVAQHFLSSWNPRWEVNHLDGDRWNNAASNLEMCTRKENVRHSIIHFLKNDYGEKSSNAKLTNAQAYEIRKRYQTESISQASLAGIYQVSRQTISAIVRYKKYIR